MTILIGTDFSKACSAVADIAAELARRRGEDLVVAHVVERGVLVDAGAIELEARRLRAFGCKVRWALLHDGAAGKRLAALAEAEAATVLVVGAQGRGLQSPLGTVATAALRHVTCPVLVVRRAELLWSMSASHHLHGLVAFALDETDASLCEAMAIVASTGDAVFDFAHYESLPAPLVAANRSSPLDEAAVRSRFAALPVGVSVRSIIERDGFGRLDAHVSDLARETKVDLVVCGSHHRHGVDRVKEGSIAEGVALHCPVSVLVARAPTASEVAARRHHQDGTALALQESPENRRF